MAKISTSIMLNDMMSQQFRAMNMAMSTVIDSFQTLQEATSEAIDVSALEVAQRELQQVEANFSQIEQEILQAEQSQYGFNNQISNGEDAVEKLTSKFVGLAATVTSIFAVGSVFKSGFDRLIGIDTAQAKLQALGHSTQTVDIIMKNAVDSVTGTAFRLEDAVNTAASAVAAGIQPGKSLERYLSLTADAAAIAGTNLNEMGAIFNKVTTSGIIQAEELNQLSDRGIPIFQMLADTMGVASDEIRKLASDGKISSQVFLNAIESGFGGAAQIMGINSFQATLDNIGAAIGRIGAAFLNGANDGQGFFDQIKPLMVDLLNTLKNFESVAAKIGDWFGRMFGFVIDNMSFIAPIVGGATAALIIYTTALIGVKTATMIASGWQTIMAARTMLLTGATLAQTAAQHGLNAAMLASPITWVIMGIVALITVFYLAIATINHFAGTSISATGIIAGAFMFLYAYIYNIVANLWNTFAALAEFFVNVWKHPIYSVKRLFYNLASNVIDHIIAMTRGWDSFATNFANAIIAGVNMAIKAWNAFIKLLPEQVVSFLGLSVGTEISYRKSITSDLQSLKSYLKNWVGEAPADYWEAPRIEYMNYSEAWNTGYNWGKNLFSGFDLDIQNQERFNMEKYMKDILNSVNGLGDAIDVGNGSAKDIAGNTGKLADSVDLLEEDMKYLRDAANAEAINRYTTGNITIDMSGMQNNINSELDLDGIVDKLVAKTEEALDSLPEGV